MVNLSITRIKYPKNDTIGYEYENLDNLFKDLKKMIMNNNVGKDDIIRINASKVVDKYTEIKEKLDELKRKNYIYDYDITNLNTSNEIILRYGLSSVGTTERAVFVVENQSLSQALFESGEDIRVDIESSLVDDDDFFGYDNAEDLEDRIVEETEFLKELSELV